MADPVADGHRERCGGGLGGRGRRAEAAGVRTLLKRLKEGGVVGILPDQVEPFRALLAAQGALEGHRLVPIVQARLARVGTREVAEMQFASESDERSVTREFAITWQDALPPGNTVVAGSWWSPEAAGRESWVSVEDSLARRLEVTGFYDLVGQVDGYSAVARAFRRGDAKVALVIPAGFSAAVTAHRPTEVQLVVDGSDPQTVGSATSTAASPAGIIAPALISPIARSRFTWLQMLRGLRLKVLELKKDLEDTTSIIPIITRMRT